MSKTHDDVNQQVDTIKDMIDKLDPEQVAALLPHVLKRVKEGGVIASKHTSIGQRLKDIAKELERCGTEGSTDPPSSNPAVPQPRRTPPLSPQTPPPTPGQTQEWSVR